MAVSTLHELLLHELGDLYDAEKQILEALPAMAEAATSTALRDAFREHEEQTKAQVERLEEIFEMLEETPKKVTCDGMQGLIKEGEKSIDEVTKGDVLDAALIAAAQRVEHYEIAGYGTARTWARLMEHEDVADLLQETLDEEADTDELLTSLAESEINVEAME